MGLNFSTLCRLGGGSTWTAQQAMAIAQEALDKCIKEREENGAPKQKIADALFARSVLYFCKAEALDNNILKQEDCSEGEESTSLYTAATQLLEDVLGRYNNVLGTTHLESIKCFTMLGLIARRVNDIKCAIKWCKKEVTLRQEVTTPHARCTATPREPAFADCRSAVISQLQGDMHPRTQQAQRVYLELVETMTRPKNTGSM